VAQTEEERREARRQAGARWRARNPAKDKAATANWQKQNSLKMAANAKQWRTTAPQRNLLSSVKARSRKKGLDCDLDMEWLLKQLEPMTCSITGVPLSFENAYLPAKNPFAPSIDQIKPGEGYTKDNCQVVSWAFNMAKGPWPIEVYDLLARSYVKNAPQAD